MKSTSQRGSVSCGLAVAWWACAKCLYREGDRLTGAQAECDHEWRPGKIVSTRLALHGPGKRAE